MPVTIGLSATLFGNYSTTNDITPVFQVFPVPPFSFGVGVDWTFDAPETYKYNLSVGVGKNASVGSYRTANGWQGLSVSVGMSVGSPVTVSPPPANNGCGIRAGMSGN